jgi:hypothetical protein
LSHQPNALVSLVVAPLKREVSPPPPPPPQLLVVEVVVEVNVLEVNVTREDISTTRVSGQGELTVTTLRETGVR